MVQAKEGRALQTPAASSESGTMREGGEEREGERLSRLDGARRRQGGMSGLL